MYLKRLQLADKCRTVQNSCPCKATRVTGWYQLRATGNAAQKGSLLCLCSVQDCCKIGKIPHDEMEHSPEKASPLSADGLEEVNLSLNDDCSLRLCICRSHAAHGNVQVAQCRSSSKF